MQLPVIKMDKNKAQFKVYIYIIQRVKFKLAKFIKINDLITKIVSLYSQVFIKGLISQSKKNFVFVYNSLQYAVHFTRRT